MLSEMSWFSFLSLLVLSGVLLCCMYISVLSRNEIQLEIKNELVNELRRTAGR